jgi:gas vesicle protein
MARQSFFQTPEVRPNSKYGAYSPDAGMTNKLKVIILLVALIGGAAVGTAYSLIAAPDLNKAAREKLRPGRETRARQQARELARKRAEMQAEWAREAELKAQQELAERLARLNPLQSLLSSKRTIETTATEATDDTRIRRTRTTRPKPTPSSETTLQDVAEEARRMLQQQKR